MRIYNKLVRDKIPEIISSDNQIPIIKILDDADYIKELNSKLQEELSEYLESFDIEELADILEVIHAILDQRNISFEELEAIRLEKAKKRGAFKNKIFLEKTEDVK